MNQLELFEHIKNKYDWLDIDTITIDDLPNEEMKIIAQECGIDVALKLMMKCSGLYFNIPVNGFNSLKAKYILKNFDGQNSRRLALQLEVSLGFVLKVIRDSYYE